MVIYLDNAATSYPKPDSVYQQMIECLQQAGANPGRAGHRLARAAQQIVEDTRLKLARFINAAAPNEIIFAFNATDGLNMAIKGLLQPGDHAITTRLEHNSVLRPLQRLTQHGVTLTLINFDREGFISPTAIEQAITPATKLIVMTAASNVLGSVQPVAAIGAIARRHNILLLVDGAQTLGALPIDVQTAQIDLLAASGHKALLGPPGSGFLYVGPRAQLTSWREGGTGGDSLSPLQPSELPFQLEAGTHNTSGIAGLRAGLEYLQHNGIEKLHHQELRLTEQLLRGLEQINGVTIYGPKELDLRTSVVAFSVEGYRSDEIAAILDESFDIAVRGGLHCAPLVHERLGTSPDGLVRASIGPFNTEAEIEQLINAVREIVG